MLLESEHACAGGPTLWQTIAFPPSDSVGPVTTCDVCIIGAGISGLCVAYELTRRGRKVLVLDAQPLGLGQTARSTAHLVTALDERYFMLEERFGPQVTRAAARAHDQAIKWIEHVVQRHHIPCGFRRVAGTLVVPARRMADTDRLLAREEVAARRAGVSATVKTSCHVLSGCSSHALSFPDQAQVHPVQLLAGLAQAIRAAGGLIVTSQRVTELAQDKDQLRLVAGGKTVLANHVVLATHSIPRALQARVRRIRSLDSFAVAYLLAPSDPIGLSLLWDGYWDDDEPYHYVRCENMTTPQGEPRQVVIVGGEDSESGNRVDAARSYALIDAWTRAHFPKIDNVVARWCGTIAEPDGEFALIGAVPDWQNLYLVAGDSGNGMTYAAIAAQRLTSMIEGRPTVPVEDLIFNPEL